jgi:hypothetical protein
MLIRSAIGLEQGKRALQEIQGFGNLAPGFFTVRPGRAGEGGADQSGMRLAAFADDIRGVAGEGDVGSRPSMWCRIGCGQRAAFSGGLGCNL